MTERLPGLAATLIVLILVVVIGLTIACGSELCDMTQTLDAPEPAFHTLPSHCIVMPDGARLCDTP